MNITKNQSGNWRIRMMIDGKTYTKTVKGKKPTENEAYQMILDMIEEQNKPLSMSFRQASSDYNKSRKNVISPSTFREYSRMCDRLPEWFVDMDIYTITQVEMQKLTNELSVDHTTKTVHNYHGYCVSVVGFFRPDVTYNTRFKQNSRVEPYIPTKSEVQQVIDYSIGTEYHIPLQLAKYSLRRSEICALLKSDLTEDNQIHVCKALVQDINKEWVVKLPKTEDSDRYVPIDDDLANEIRALDRDRIYPYYPQNLTKYLKKTQDKLGLPHFTVHKMRHYFASALHGIVPEADIQKMGGWKNDTVLKQVYTHSDIFLDKSTQKKVLETL